MAPIVATFLISAVHVVVASLVTMCAVLYGFIENPGLPILYRAGQELTRFYQYEIQYASFSSFSSEVKPFKLMSIIGLASTHPVLHQVRRDLVRSGHPPFLS